MIGDICKKIIEQAVQSKKPLVIEKLDFQKKKASVRETKTAQYRRLLSSFAYNLFFSHLIARAYKHGITIHSVNPAYTSIIGQVNYAKRYGLSSHLSPLVR
jgi:IS605 OrfB family transposase